MASETGDSEAQSDGSHEPRECMPCRGTGQVISTLGGAPSTRECPWCGGSGVRAPASDAQARWLSERATLEAAASGSTPPGEPEPSAQGSPSDSAA